MKKFNYQNKTIIVTGASSGIGKDVASILINKYNAKVIAVARNEEKLISVKNSFNEKSNLYVVYPFDVGDYNAWLNFKNNLIENKIEVDGIINCAGVLPEFTTFNKTDILEFEKVINVNFYSVVYSAKTILPLVNAGGFITNVTSSSALCPFAGVSAYTASKSACERFSIALSCEVKNVSVTTVMPGFTKTNIMRSQTINDKESGVIGRLSASSMKVAKKILTKTAKRKKRLITGIDAHFMNFLFKFFPTLSPRFITWFLKKSNFSTFENIFN